MKKQFATSLALILFSTSSVAVKNAGEYSPVFSPDGKSLAYHKNSENISWDIVIRDIHSGDEKQITDTPGFEVDADWSPDGKRLVFAASDGQDWDIQMYDLQKNTLEVLVQNPGLDHSPSFSKDGKTVLFLSKRNGAKQIFGVDIHTKAVKQLSNTGKEINHPSMSADGRFLLFDQYFENAAGEGGRSKIFQLDVKTNEVSFLYEAPGSTIAAQRNGDMLYVTNNAGGNWDIVQVNLKTGESIAVAGEPVNEMKASISPDGDKMAYSLFNNDGTAKVAIKPLKL